MFLANDVRIMVKGFCILIFVVGMFFPVVTVEIEVESTDSRIESFDDDLIVIHTNSYLEGELNEGNDEVSFTKARQHNILTWTIQTLLFLGIALLTLSLLADLLEKEEGFIGEWTSTFAGFASLLLLYFVIMLQVFLLESDLTTENGKSLFDRTETSQGTVSSYVNIHETIMYRLLQIGLASFLILPISNRLIKEKYPYPVKTAAETSQPKPKKNLIPK